MLSYVHPDTNPDLLAECPIHLNLYNPELISGEIVRYKHEGYFVILILQWGGKFEGGGCTLTVTSLNMPDVL